MLDAAYDLVPVTQEIEQHQGHQQHAGKEADDRHAARRYLRQQRFQEVAVATQAVRKGLAQMLHVQIQLDAPCTSVITSGGWCISVMFAVRPCRPRAMSIASASVSARSQPISCGTCVL